MLWERFVQMIEKYDSICIFHLYKLSMLTCHNFLWKGERKSLSQHLKKSGKIYRLAWPLLNQASYEVGGLQLVC